MKQAVIAEILCNFQQFIYFKRIIAMNVIRENTLKKISETCFLMIHKDKAKSKKIVHTSGEIKSLTFFSTIFS